MHPRNRTGSSRAPGVDGESLQADVMRFMAIIGFCLVAIMGLVREVSPPESQPEALPEPPHAKQPARTPTIEDLPVPQPRPAVVAAVVAEAPTPNPAAKPKPKPKPKPAPISAPTQTAVVEPMPTQNTPEPPDLQPESLPAAAEDAGLSLRFRSEADFLRLLAKGEVALYLFDDARAFRLGRNYSLREAPAPQQVYELMPQTIPAALRLSADSVVTDSSLYQWGVVMPERIAQRIQSMVAVETSGQLVVDRFGTVRHTASAAAKPERQSRLEGQG